MKQLRLLMLLLSFAVIGAGCGAAFAVSGEQTAERLDAIAAAEAEAAADAGADDDETLGDETGEDSPVDETAPDEASDATGGEAGDTADDAGEAPAPDEAAGSDELASSLGVIQNSADALDGQVLFGPAQGASQYLVANDGTVTQTWTRFGPGQPDGDAELLPSGLVLRTSPAATIDGIGATGRIELIEENGTVAWSCTLNEGWFGGQHFQGDVTWIEPDPGSGNDQWGSLMVSAYLVQSGDQLGTIGKNLTASDRVYVDSLIEIAPNATDGELDDQGGSYRRGDCGPTLWEWRATDRIQFDAADLPVPGGVDWTSFSSIDYNQDLDMVAVASPTLGEVWIIDHSTDTEASSTDSVNAELLARYTGASEPSAVSWAGGLLLVVSEGAVYSVDTSDDSADKLYELSGDYGYAEQLPNGNLLITDSDVGRVIELGATGEIVWEFVSPVINDGTGTSPDQVLDLDADVPPGQNRIGRAYKYPASYSGIGG